MNQKTIAASPHRENQLAAAIKAVFAATHGRGMTRKEQAELILPGGNSPFFISSRSCVIPETEQDRYSNVG